MADTYRYAVNNVPREWQVTVAPTDEAYQARTTAMGQDFEATGTTAEDALGQLKEAMEKIGWFFHLEFSK